MSEIEFDMSFQVFFSLLLHFFEKQMTNTQHIHKGNIDTFEWSCKSPQKIRDLPDLPQIAKADIHQPS